MSVSRGSQALAAEIQKRGWSLNRAEREIKGANALVSRLIRGDRNPGLESALAIERAFGVPAEWWLEPPAPDESGDTLPDVNTGTHG